MASSALVSAIATLFSTLIGGFIAYLVAQKKLQSRRELTIDDWYAKATLLADQVQRAKPDTYSTERKRKTAHQRFNSLSERLDEHVVEAPGGADRDTTRILDELTEACYVVTYLAPSDSKDYRDAIEDAISKANELQSRIDSISD